MFLATARARHKWLRLSATLRREKHRPRSYGPARHQRGFSIKEGDRLDEVELQEGDRLDEVELQEGDRLDKVGHPKPGPKRRL